MSKIKSKQIADFLATVDWNTVDATDIANASDIKAYVDNEITGVDGDTSDLADSVDSLEVALSTEISATNSDVTRIDAALSAEISDTNSDVTRIDAALSAEISATNSDVTRIDGNVTSVETKLSTEKARVDAILQDAGATDTFSEIVSLINQVDIENDDAFGAYALATDSSVDSLETALSAEISATNDDVAAINDSVDSLEVALSAEINATNDDVDSIDVRFSDIELNISDNFISEDDFVKEEFIGSGLSYTLTTAPALNSNAVVNAYVNGLLTEISTVVGTAITLSNPGFTVDADDTVLFKYVTN